MCSLPGNVECFDHNVTSDLVEAERTHICVNLLGTTISDVE